MQNQLGKTIKPYRTLFSLKNIHKPKVEHHLNARLIHKFQNEDYDNSKDFNNVSLINPNKQISHNNNTNQLLSINHHKTDSINGDRQYLEKYPSVTTILANTKPLNEFYSLLNWKKANMKKLGKEKFGLMQRDVTTKGTNFHQDMKEYFADYNNLTDRNNLTDCKLYTTGFIKSVCEVLPNISNPLAVESATVHSHLGYAGTVDLVAEYKGKLSMIDWKTSKRKRVKLSDCHSYPVQVAAYAGAVNYDDDYPFQIMSGILVIAYENGDPADVHVMNEDLCEEYWEKWLLRLHKYRALRSGDSMGLNGTKQITKDHYIHAPISPLREVPHEPTSFTKSNGDSMGLIGTKQIIKDHYIHAPISPFRKVPQELTPSTKSTENVQGFKTISIGQSACRTSQHRGKLLYDIGQTVKDEEVLATWRSLSELSETIFGRALLSQGMLMYHYIRCLCKTSFDAVVSRLNMRKQ